MTVKTCRKCNQEKALDQFNRKGADGLQPICRQCQHDYYIANRERHLENVKRTNRERKKLNRVIVYDYLRSHPCVDCGESDIAVLEFDHVRGKKTASVKVMMNHATVRRTLEREIAKCDVRCANCHRRRHAPSIPGEGRRNVP